MSHSSTILLLISLEKDEARRKDLESRLPRYYGNIQRVNAINGSDLTCVEFYKHASNHFKTKNRLLSPSEIGCFLSHQIALHRFIKSDSSHALILEDDISVTDEDIDLILKVNATLPPHSIFIPGGQNGLPSQRYLLGKPTMFASVYRLYPFSGKHLWRTCCYVVDRPTAIQILERTVEFTTVADDWRYFFQEAIPSYFYSRSIQHPTDLSSSHIEKFRIEKSNNKALGLTHYLDLASRVYQKLKSEVMRLFGLMCGYKQL
ncbi:MAG: glycosyltransferase family 25 protein [Limnobacter sp.]|uniref:glycosyltransferase family 25 protein n=1 Tax=Limnobacter sp. TaxID=2003368 RepID=UPI0030028BD0